MARILFEFDIDVPATAVSQALLTTEGIAGWWTDDVSVSDSRPVVISLGFPVAPARFKLRVDESTDKSVRWANVGAFPPHWADTTVSWSLTPTDSGTHVRFDHDGWAADDAGFATAAYTWGQLMVTLKTYCETATASPLFSRE